MRRKIYMTAGFNTVSMGTGRKEFNPKKARPGLEHYFKEAGQGSIKQINDAENVDEISIGNFMAARFNKQANLPGFAAYIDDKGLLNILGKLSCNIRNYFSARNKPPMFIFHRRMYAI